MILPAPNCKIIFLCLNLQIFERYCRFFTAISDFFDVRKTKNAKNYDIIRPSEKGPRSFIYKVKFTLLQSNFFLTNFSFVFWREKNLLCKRVNVCQKFIL
jgi:hypothetical protein